MPIFLWEAQTKRGETKKGELDATDEAAVRAQLRRQGFKSINVKGKPKDLLEYVVVHEMLHLLEPTHSRRFTDLLDLHYPTWREARAELNELPLAAESWSVK